eukprot:CAMPEP_0113945344 /NCGR_PEP_ID=MMETSP1339-20121228/44359_1 /TAXON_ID=94617 /ORGANISM="Fibrocapsa japonica" /LENGTH=53 /DNA_ID=CAMNT_0000950885 /DNA_START=242 /DNA_END=400 /DNA_ORIENTATION=+ /assembly_acc=CAM_ASM_000762
MAIDGLLAGAFPFLLACVHGRSTFSQLLVHLLSRIGGEAQQALQGEQHVQAHA